jgi:hypothetical protein
MIVPADEAQPTQFVDAPCPTCAGDAGTPAFVYAIGRIEARFPSAGVEKEFAQATARADTVSKSDEQAFREVLSQRANRYLARQLCWVLTIQGLDTYILRPRDPADLDLLIEALRAPGDPEPWLNCVVGLRGPMAPPEFCNGLMVPIVLFEQLYTFDRTGLIAAIPAPRERTPAFEASAEEVFMRVLQTTDNAGASNEDRALNYLALRYPAIYTTAAECHARDFALTAVETRPSSLSSIRNIVDVVFIYSNRKTDFTERFLVRVDVTETFPFLVTKLSSTYDR